MAVTPDGKHVYVANAGDGTVSVIDTATNTAGSPISVGNQPEGVVVSPDGTRLYVTNYGGTVSVIDTATNTVIGNPIPVDHPYTVAISPDGTRLYVPSSVAQGNTVSVIDTTANAVIGGPITVGRVPFGVAVTPDGKHVYVANATDGTVSVIDTATNKVVGEPISAGTGVNFLAVSPDGARIYVTSQADNSVSTINTATNTIIGNPISIQHPYTLAVSPDGSRLYVVGNMQAPGGTSQNTVTVIDTATNTIIGNPINVAEYPQGIAVSPDGTRVYVAGSYGSLSVIDTGQRVATGGGGLTGGSGPGDGSGATGGSSGGLSGGSFLDQIGAFIYNYVPGKYAQYLNIGTALLHGDVGGAVYDVLQAGAGIAEASHIPLVSGIGYFIDLGSTAVKDLAESGPQDLGNTLNYVVHHPFGAIGGGASSVVDAVGSIGLNTLTFGLLPQSVVDGLIKPADQGIIDGGNTLDTVAQNIGSDISTGLNNLGDAVGTGINNAENFAGQAANNVVNWWQHPFG
ncbi:YncE family protein [Mycolicibacterium sp. CBMA 226]|uniref:YncE family protein n=1 Tax=Mycolicibacterium sp. CBMA 226 TaxID=2606611 RepID=UPI0028BE701B|nr:YncE family protein [Mycolicibacterium sp. CBMA 226]